MSSSSENTGAVVFFLFAAGPAAGVFVWGAIQAKYRNRNARYMPEKVVSTKVTKITNDDKFTRKLTSQSSSISGRNDTEPNVRAKFTKTTKE